MEDIYNFLLDIDEFERVLNGKKTTHLVINSPKHKSYAVGNKISFSLSTEKMSEEDLEKFESENKPKTVNAEISNLLYFADPKEAIETLGKETCGFKQSSTFEKASDLFLAGDSFETIEKYGIVAVVFSVEN